MLNSPRINYSLSFHLDDILLVWNEKKIIITTKGWLFSTFEMKDIGETNYVIRVKILSDHLRRLVGLSQGIE